MQFVLGQLALLEGAGRSGGIAPRFLVQGWGCPPPPRDSVLHDILHFKEVVSLATEVVFYIFISSGKSGVHQREDAKEKEMGGGSA